MTGRQDRYFYIHRDRLTFSKDEREQSWDVKMPKNAIILCKSNICDTSITKINFDGLNEWDACGEFFFENSMNMVVYVMTDWWLWSMMELKISFYVKCNKKTAWLSPTCNLLLTTKIAINDRLFHYLLL